MQYQFSQNTITPEELINISFDVHEFEVLRALFMKEIANRDSLGSSQASKWTPYVDSVLRKIESCKGSLK